MIRANVKDLHAMRDMIASGAALPRLLQSAAGEALHQVRVGFRTETDPDGAAWQPLKRRRGKILRKTARMSNSFTSRATAKGFVVGSNVAYVGFHQEGTAGHSTDFARFQRLNVAESGRQTFVTKTGKARIRQESGKRKLTYLGFSRFTELQFRQGGGAIPIRRMVPANGILTPRWQEAIDKTSNSTMLRMVKEMGGH